MRGLACVTMFQAHCYDSWLNPEARKTVLYRWSQELSTLPALIFLFLCGVSFVLVTERLRQKKRPSTEIFKTALLRGAEIFGLGLLLRVQEFVLGYPKSPWTDLFRVDVLNILGVSILMALFWRLTASPGVTAALPPIALLVSFRTTVLGNRFVAGHCGSHCSGHASVVDDSPASISALDAGVVYQWGAHIRCSATVAVFDFSLVWICFCGLGVWFISFLGLCPEREVTALGAVGAWSGGMRVISVVGLFVPQIYAVYDYWHSSPNFFLMRCGILLILAFAIFAWCRWGWATKGFSPLIQLGKLRCWSTGRTSSLFMGGYRFCRSGEAAFRFRP